MSHHPERTARNVRPVNQPPSYIFYGNKKPGYATNTWRFFRGGNYSVVAADCVSTKSVMGSTSGGGGYVTTGFRLAMRDQTY